MKYIKKANTIQVFLLFSILSSIFACALPWGILSTTYNDKGSNSPITIRTNFNLWNGSVEFNSCDSDDDKIIKINPIYDNTSNTSQTTWLSLCRILSIITIALLCISFVLSIKDGNEISLKNLGFISLAIITALTNIIFCTTTLFKDSPMGAAGYIQILTILFALCTLFFSYPFY
tara:strand:+ start:254 stop:778 length:525 start_codon:yes stop_codon:yes gene_type:complete